MSEQPATGQTPIDALGLPVVLLSHRGPVSFARSAAGRTAQRGSGGLVTALTGLAGHLPEAVWVCAATSDEDRRIAVEYGDKAVDVALEPAAHISEGDEPGPHLRLRLVDVDPRQHEDFYSVIANPLLWFVQHGLYGLASAPELTRREREAFDTGYAAVNAHFADAVVEQVHAHGGRALVMLHDYHFYLVAERVRRECPRALITHFTHIPWPEPDSWRVLPPDLRERIFRGMLGNDVVAFHTRRFARNFLLGCQELLGLRVDLDAMTVTAGGREVLARYYPISVDVASMEAMMGSDAVQEHLQALDEAFLSDRKMILRVDRTDPSKNIVRGFRAFDTMLGDHPELVGTVRFFALLQPSRQDIPEYFDYIGAIGGVVAEINARHGADAIELRLESDLPLAVAAYSRCDVLMVNALNDGMNLVAKEMVLVNSRGGVLLLSENTGAHEELGEFAITVYPFDIQQQADALYAALTMPAAERQDRLVAAAAVVRHNDVGRWLRRQIRDVLRLPAATDG